MPFRILTVRGESSVSDEPIVVLTRPEFVGGQEFDAVVAVGVEQGLVPPRIIGHPAMAAAVGTAGTSRAVSFVHPCTIPTSGGEWSKQCSVVIAAGRIGDEFC